MRVFQDLGWLAAMPGVERLGDLAIAPSRTAFKDTAPISIPIFPGFSFITAFPRNQM
jgi:hypothetical protein